VFFAQISVSFSTSGFDRFIVRHTIYLCITYTYNILLLFYTLISNMHLWCICNLNYMSQSVQIICNYVFNNKNYTITATICNEQFYFIFNYFQHTNYYSSMIKNIYSKCMFIIHMCKCIVIFIILFLQYNMNEDRLFSSV